MIMKNKLLLLLSLSAVIVAGVGLSSCKDDDDEPTKYQLTFKQATSTTVEDAGDIEVELNLDKPAPEDITIKYKLTGTAYDAERAEEEETYSDFVVDGEYEEVEIQKGETSGAIKLKLYSDDFLEDPETIILTVESVDNENVEFTADAKTEITLNQENGMVVLLDWPAAGTSGVADMDILVRIGETAENWDGIVTGSVYRGFEYNYEFVFIPKTYVGTLFDLGYTNATFGLSYTYYDGSLDPLNFKVTFIDFNDGALEPDAQRQVFEKTYTEANLNKWVSATPPTIIAQTFKNEGGQFTEISEITIPETSSRVSGQSSSKYLRTSTSINQKSLPKIYKDLF
jgi:hypothetical protein